jgi:hypothetical protein
MAYFLVKAAQMKWLQEMMACRAKYEIRNKMQ